MERIKLLLVYNPNAGQGQIIPHLPRVIDLFTKAGALVTAYPTQAQDDARTFLEKRARDYDLVVVSGGDGTLHEAVNALMTFPQKERPPIGYLPAGSTCDFAVSHDIPKDVIKAVRQIIKGTSAPFDIGRFGKQYFSYVAAFGSFTDVTYDTPQDEKRVLGYLAYVVEGARRLSTYRAYHLNIDADGEKISGYFIVGLITNSTSVGGMRLRSSDISLHDGLSELILVRATETPLDTISMLNAIAKQDFSSEKLVYRKAKNITLDSVEPISWTLDGEYGGTMTHVETSCCQNALRIMVGQRMEQETQTELEMYGTGNETDDEASLHRFSEL